MSRTSCFCWHVREWLPEGHFAHHVSDLVDGLTAFYARRRRSAQRASRMVKVLLYGYATGVFSSRRRKLEEDVAFRVLGAGNFPSHRTLCEFRRRHLEDFKGLFLEVVGVARGACAFREAVDRRDEGAGERKQAQELRCARRRSA